MIKIETMNLEVCYVTIWLPHAWRHARMHSHLNLVLPQLVYRDHLRNVG